MYSVVRHRVICWLIEARFCSYKIQTTESLRYQKQNWKKQKQKTISLLIWSNNEQHILKRITMLFLKPRFKKAEN